MAKNGKERQIKDRLANVRLERDDLLGRVEGLQEEERRLTIALEVLAELSGYDEPDDEPSRKRAEKTPSLKSRILALIESDTEPFATERVFAALNAETPEQVKQNSVGATLSGLVAEGLIQKAGSGTYQRVPKTHSEMQDQAIDSEGSPS